MAYTAIELGLLAGQTAMLEIPCRRCSRRGRLKVEKLIEKHGPNKSLIELKNELTAHCPRPIEKKPPSTSFAKRIFRNFRTLFDRHRLPFSRGCITGFHRENIMDKETLILAAATLASGMISTKKVASENARLLVANNYKVMKAILASDGEIQLGSDYALEYLDPQTEKWVPIFPKTEDDEGDGEGPMGLRELGDKLT
jgi:hypothetical protein